MLQSSKRMHTLSCRGVMTHQLFFFITLTPEWPTNQKKRVDSCNYWINALKYDWKLRQEQQLMFLNNVGFTSSKWNEPLNFESTLPRLSPFLNGSVHWRVLQKRGGGKKITPYLKRCKSPGCGGNEQSDVLCLISGENLVVGGTVNGIGLN